jgi:hypothetical protein
VASTLSAIAATRMHISGTSAASIPSPAPSIDPATVVEPCATAVNDPAAARAHTAGAEENEAENYGGSWARGAQLFHGELAGFAVSKY